MIEPQFFVEEVQKRGTTFFTGVPDSLLKSLCAYITDSVDREHHIIAANEGNAVALGCGAYLASGRIPLVYMQNSGQGNAVNPLLSLADEDVYQIPVLLVIGWRGGPGVADEPQHKKQGKVTLSLLEAMGIPYQVLSGDGVEAKGQIAEAYAVMEKNLCPYALIVRKNLFAEYTLKNGTQPSGTMSREEAIDCIVSKASASSIFVSTTGMASRELYEIREKNAQPHESDFLTVGSMGHTSQIALGIALVRKDRKVYCLDGDGATLMHLGGMAIIGSQKPRNYCHIILNNGSHDSVGGQPTVARDVDLVKTALALGYDSAVQVSTKEELAAVLEEKDSGLRCIEVLVKRGNRKNLGRPKSTPSENKHAFMRYIAEGSK
ncbi:MAG: phosphonopyruvate decarboxylase [Sphaerochaeta sp.]|nr:phosphonopyruvate decarboxylase [Sphaerochaeta sp.]